MQDIQCQLTVSRGQFLADKRPLKKLTNFGFFFATLHFSTRSIKWTYLEEILAKFAYPSNVCACIQDTVSSRPHITYVLDARILLAAKK